MLRAAARTASADSRTGRRISRAALATPFAMPRATAAASRTACAPDVAAISVKLSAARVDMLSVSARTVAFDREVTRFARRCFAMAVPSVIMHSNRDANGPRMLGTSQCYAARRRSEWRKEIHR